MIAVSLISIIVSSLIAINMRYAVAFFWLLLIPANLCAGVLYTEAQKKEQEYAAFVGKLHLAAVIISCIVLFGWGMVGESDHIGKNNPVVIRYLADMLMVF
jgi:hypothetical protein